MRGHTSRYTKTSQEEIRIRARWRDARSRKCKFAIIEIRDSRDEYVYVYHVRTRRVYMIAYMKLTYVPHRIICGSCDDFDECSPSSERERKVYRDKADNVKQLRRRTTWNATIVWSGGFTCMIEWLSPAGPCVWDNLKHENRRSNENSRCNPSIFTDTTAARPGIKSELCHTLIAIFSKDLRKAKSNILGSVTVRVRDRLQPQ